ncbi:uncharacterized protein LOC117785915 [Drosophila innubila]|uniref:uncharacterized protein LOC117785915 n=1 Tax=Drosophila innubila TaxID=198719 RepID=UPI00148DFE87|nr:uncharacterized protein LOC117785915 [Drosophila innubila]
MRSTIIAIGVFLLWISIKLWYTEAVIFKLTNAVCESYNESWFVIHQCRLRAVNRVKITFNFNGIVLHPANNISVNGQIFKKANGYKPWVLKASIDVCRFLKKTYNPFAILVFNLFKEFTNFNHSCPFMGPQIVDGFYLRPELLRLPFPSGEYLFEITWLFDKKPQFATNVYFVFTEDL